MTPEAMYFEVEGKFIMNLAREEYWMSNRRFWAKSVLRCLEGITEQQIMDILNGDAILTGWSRMRNVKSEQVSMKYDADAEWKKKVEERKEYIPTRFIEIIPDRLVHFDSLASLMILKLKLVNFLAEGSRGKPLEQVEQAMEEKEEEIAQWHHQVVEKIKTAFEDGGYYHVEDDDIEQFMDTLNHRYDIKDVARMRKDIADKIEKIVHEVELDSNDASAEEREKFIEALEKKANLIHKYANIHPWVAVPDAMSAIKQGLDEHSEFRIAFGLRIAGDIGSPLRRHRKKVDERESDEE